MSDREAIIPLDRRGTFTTWNSNATTTITVNMNLPPYRWDLTHSDKEAWKGMLRSACASSFKFLEKEPNVYGSECSCGGPPGHVPNGLNCRRPL